MLSACQKILNLLSDHKWHCGQELNDLYIKDDRRRITDLKRKGYQIESQLCNLGHIHNSRLYMRRLKPTESQIVYDFREEYTKRLSVPKQLSIGI